MEDGRFRTVSKCLSAIAITASLVYGGIFGVQEFREPERIEQTRLLVESQDFQSYIQKREELFSQLEDKYLITEDVAKKSGRRSIASPEILRYMVDTVYGENPIK